MIASADYGANTPGDTFTGGGSAPLYDPQSPPSPGSSGPLVMRYEYDSAGRQWRLTHADGTMTETEYDDLGRARLVTENAGDVSASKRRQTAYDYDEQGRLVRMGALLMAVANFAAVPWSAADGYREAPQILGRGRRCKSE